MQAITVLVFLVGFSNEPELILAEEEPGQPWLNPLQELQSISYECSHKIHNYFEIAYREQKLWQNCVDKITLAVTEKYPVLERASTVEEETINSSVIYEIDRKLHMVICSEPEQYKKCWSGIVQAINLCKPKLGNVSAKIYFALYDDICREGGRITVETRRQAALAGNLCTRNYSIPACTENQAKIFSYDSCERFYSNAACDLASIDPNCTNAADKNVHPEIFKRVEKVLKCSPPPRTKSFASSSTRLQLNSCTSYIFLILIAAYLI